MKYWGMWIPGWYGSAYASDDQQTVFAYYLNRVKEMDMGDKSYYRKALWDEKGNILWEEPLEEYNERINKAEQNQ